MEVGKELGKNEYVASDPEKGKIKKSVVYFLALAKNDDIKLKVTGGLDDAKWFKMKELPELKIYDDIKRHIGGSAQRIEQKMNFSKFEEKNRRKIQRQKSAQTGFHSQVLSKRKPVFGFGAK